MKVLDEVQYLRWAKNGYLKKEGGFYMCTQKELDKILQSAKMLMADKDYKGAANRSYYTAFHCMRAVLAMEDSNNARR